MDRIDSFYQEMDSESLLDRHGPDLTKEAREILRMAPPHARLGGMILMSDSKDGQSFNEAMAKAMGQTLPAGEVVGLIPRRMIEPLLRSSQKIEHWLEGEGEQQAVLPVMVATRDGIQFGFFGLAPDAAEA